MSADDRTRFVYHEWPRDPRGHPLPTPPPKGQRPSNGFIWGNSLDDFFWVQRIPGINVMTVWSESMIREYGENYAGAVLDDRPAPVKLQPWSLLKVRQPGAQGLDIAGPVDNHDLGVSISSDSMDLDTPELSEDTGSGDSESCTAASEFGQCVGDGKNDGEDVHMTNADAVKIQQATLDEEHQHNAVGAEVLIMNRDLDASKMTHADAVTSTKYHENGRLKKRLKLDESVTEPANDQTSNPNRDDNVPTTSTETLQIEPIPREMRFKDTPKLEEKIPEEYFPDVLMVHDPDRVTSGRQSNNIYHPQNESKTPKKYLRLYPRLPRDDPLGGTPAATQTISDEPLTAYLDLAAAPLLGRGNHSFVHRASLRLPSPLEVDSSTGEVTVAAKTAFNDYDERKMLADEGKIYDAFPEHLMESWSGFNLVAPLKDPVPVGPVVPRFYGYYVCNNDPTERLSPILLQEECGTPVKPKLLTPDDRSECFSLLFRLHNARFLQNSLYVRNVLVQPGPLTKPSASRSIETPSFRIIDFGRANCWDNDIKTSKDSDGLAAVWWENKNSEVAKAQEELQLKYFEF